MIATTITELKPMVVIIGGGLVGLLLASLLADVKIHVAVVETKEPLLYWDKESWDARVSAINAVSKRLLEKIGVWDSLGKEAYSSLVRLKAWDSLGGGEITFDSADIGSFALGAIVENRQVIRALWENLKNNPRVELIFPTRPVRLLRSDRFIELELENARKIKAACVVGADGPHSWLRGRMNIEINEHSYEQSAIIAIVQTENKHERTGWQVFLPQAVLALLPLSDSRCSAIVWSVPTEKALDLLAMNEKTFTRELNKAFEFRLGKIQCLNKPKSIPLVMRHAKQYVVQRMALVGDAAHSIHPLAGQGVNLGFMDAACLAQCIADAYQRKKDIGSLRVLRRYERWRKGDNLMMLAAMHLFKEGFGSEFPPLIQARTVGLNITDRFTFLKNYFMKVAMGESNDLPDLIHH